MHRLAQDLGLEGKSCKYYLKTVGEGFLEKSSTLYHFWMEDREGHQHQLKALGIETITQSRAPISLDGVRDIFPEASDEVFYRGGGEIDILLGKNFCHLLPWADRSQTKDNLRLMDSLFGCGQVLTGSHPSILSKEVVLTTDAKMMVSMEKLG